ncbi:hypothetical protein [Microseira wollei]|uniref:hypothetical protein n=1 Tax=Microseira wollei TaxID=467598 RepID=UPI001CFE418E|nr:hypothetical protein [Microseira wollei]
MPDGFTIKSVTVRQRQDGWYISVRIEEKTVPDYAAFVLRGSQVDYWWRFRHHQV